MAKSPEDIELLLMELLESLCQAFSSCLSGEGQSGLKAYISELGHGLQLWLL